MQGRIRGPLRDCGNRSDGDAHQPDRGGHGQDGTTDAHFPITPSVTPVPIDSQDTLQINTLAGNDTVDSSGLQPGLVQLRVL